ncbi:virginiamycin B lyase family protein, partial [Escherichia coli]|uniref:virginiamycin B lyase family protein n=1 Tax=Escherichia coli TaxID=562 RepID=UPI003F51DD63
MYVLPQVSESPSGITLGSDGNIWYSSLDSTSTIGKITTSGAITEYSAPSASAAIWVIATGPDGNIWGCEETTDKIV